MRCLRLVDSACIALIALAMVAAGPVTASAKPKYSAIVIDRNTGKTLYSRNADAQRYPASLTKMMTLYIVFDLIESGRLSYKSQLRVTANAARQQPSKLGLKTNSKISLHNAIRALVTKSANDVAVTIAENLAGTEAKFARIMTWKARQIGMKKTVFKNASGLPNSRQVTTARDMAMLGDRLIADFPKHYSFFKQRYFAYKGRSYRNHNSLLHNFKGTDGIKTGYTRASGFNLVASVKRGGKHLIGVVMGGKTSRHRNANMRTMLAGAFKKASRKKSRRVYAAAPRTRIATPMIANLRPEESTRTVSRGLSRPSRAKARLNVPIPQPVLRRPVQYRAAQSRGRTKPVRVDARRAQNNRAHGPFHIQVGAFATKQEAETSLWQVRRRVGPDLNAHKAFTQPFNAKNKKLYYRARFAGFTRSLASSFCDKVKAAKFDCIVMRAE